MPNVAPKDQVTKTKKRRTWQRRNELRAGETLNDLEAEARELRDKAIRRLVATADRLDFFGVVVSRARLEEGLKLAMSPAAENADGGTAAATEARRRKRRQTKFGTLKKRLQEIRRNVAKEGRRLATRRKILLGSFLIAQVAHKPALHDDVRSRLERFLDRHRNEDVRAANRLLLADWLGAEPPRLASERESKRKPTRTDIRTDTHRKILLGSFMGAWIAEVPEISVWVRPELAKFIDLHNDPETRRGNRVLLADWLGDGPHRNSEVASDPARQDATTAGKGKAKAKGDKVAR